jgi:hypothetical protein
MGSRCAAYATVLYRAPDVPMPPAVAAPQYRPPAMPAPPPPFAYAPTPYAVGGLYKLTHSLTKRRLVSNP